MPRPYDTDEENKFGNFLLFSFVVYYVFAISWKHSSYIFIRNQVSHPHKASKYIGLFMGDSNEHDVLHNNRVLCI